MLYRCRLKEQPTIGRTLDKDVCLDLSSIAVDEVQHSPYQRDDKMSRDDPKAILCEESLPALVRNPTRETNLFTMNNCIQIKSVTIKPPLYLFAPKKNSKTIFSLLGQKIELIIEIIKLRRMSLEIQSVKNLVITEKRLF